MNKAKLIKKVAEKTNCVESVVKEILDGTIATITEELASGGLVYFGNLGKFYTNTLNATKIRSPKTGEKLDVPERKVPRITFSKVLKRAIKEAQSK